MKAKITTSGKNNTVVNGNSNNININHYYKPINLKVETKVIQHNSDIHISQEQQAKIQEIIKETYEMMKGYKDNIHAVMFGGLKKKFKITQYSLLPKEHYQDAIHFLYIERSKYRKELKVLNASRFKEYTIPAIRARWHIYRKGEDLLEFASVKLRKNVTDLEKLSANDLDTLYTRVFSIKK